MLFQGGDTGAEYSELILQKPDGKNDKSHMKDCSCVADGRLISESLGRSGPRRRSCFPFKFPSDFLLAFVFCVHCQWYELYSPKEKRCIEFESNSANPVRKTRHQ